MVRQAVNVTRPPSRTTRPSSPLVWKTASPSPVSHILTVSASPGKTGEEKRPSIERNRAGSPPHSDVEQRPAGEAVGAQAVEDRLREAAHGRERRVGVQRVAVARQAVDQRLVLAGRVGHLVVGRPVGRHVAAARRPAVAAQAALAPDERPTCDVVNSGSPVATSVDLSLGLHHRALALVVDAGDLADGSSSPSAGIGAVQLDRLLAVDEHRRVERADGRHARRRAEAEHHGHGGQHLLRRLAVFSVVNASSSSGSTAPAPTPSA